MVAIVLAGSGSGAGKTAVGCSLIAALPEFNWIAYKLSPDRYKSESIFAETDSTSTKDTGRYLAAGAKRAYLLSLLLSPRVDPFFRLLNELDSFEPGSSVLVESNQIESQPLEQTGRKVVCLTVLSGAPSTWKESIWPRIPSSDALVLTNGLIRDRLPSELQSKAVFVLDRGIWNSAELTQFIRDRFMLALG